MNTKILEEAGFTKSEIKVYLSLLELGETTTGDIINKSKITGSKIYEVLDRLIEKGLVSYVIKEKTKYFQASSPERLLDFIEKKQQEANNQKKEIECMIPSLKSIQKSNQKIQSAQIFEGYEGIKSVFSLILESLKPNDEYYAFYLGDELNYDMFAKNPKNKKLQLFLLNFHAKRISKKITFKIIANKKSKSLFKTLSQLKKFEIRYYNYPVPLGVYIFKDYIATVAVDEKPTVFLIKSEKVANSYKNFFNHIWSISNK